MVASKTPIETMWRLNNLSKTGEVVLRYFKDNEQRICLLSAQSYICHLNKFFEYSKLEYDLVKPKHIKAWLYELDQTGHKPKSINNSLIALRSFYQYCLEEELICESPTSNIRVPKPPDGTLRYLDRPTLARLMELTKKEPRERAMVATLYATGVRISELLSIRLEDVDWEERKIMIRQGKGNKDRLVLFTSECDERLKDFLGTLESPYLFAKSNSKPLRADWARLKFQGYTKALVSGTPITPHTMRHTFAAHLVEKKMPLEYIQELLGHVFISTTKIYTKLSPQIRKKQYDYYQ